MHRVGVGLGKPKHFQSAAGRFTTGALSQTSPSMSRVGTRSDSLHLPDACDRESICYTRGGVYIPNLTARGGSKGQPVTST